MLQRDQIEAILPHREPFLWLDRVTELIPGEYAVAEPVVPGDTLRLEVHMSESRGRIGKGEAKAFVGSELVSSGTLTFAVAEP